MCQRITPKPLFHHRKERVDSILNKAAGRRFRMLPGEERVDSTKLHHKSHVSNVNVVQVPLTRVAVVGEVRILWSSCSQIFDNAS